MSSTTYQRLGVRYGRFQTYRSRFSPGKVHLYIWRKDIKEWVTACRFVYGTDFGHYHGQQVDADEPVTCKKCLKHPEAES